MTKRFLLLALTAALGLGATTARAEGWVGYMNWFFLNNGTKGDYASGSPWGLGDLRTTVTQSNAGTYIGDRLTLEPNYNLWVVNPEDPTYWINNGVANKFLEANTFVEFSPITTLSTSFAGVVNSYTLDSAYDAIAFIKVLNPATGYSLDVFQTFDLSTGSSFNLSADLSAHQGKILQLGFAVLGLNANPAGPALGSVDVSVIPEPSAYSALAGLAAIGLTFRRRRR